MSEYSDAKAVAALLREVHAALDSEQLVPDPSRQDWDQVRDSLLDLHRRALAALLELPAATAELRGEDAERLREGFCNTVIELGGVLYVAGLTQEGYDLLRRASEQTQRSQTAAFCRAAIDSSDAYGRILLATHFIRKREPRRADRMLKALKKERLRDPLANRVVALLDRPRPLRHAPAMTTINGIGTRLYGGRDPRPDGSVIGTLYFVVLFIPIVPLSAYRVLKHGNGRYSFQSQCKLGGFALWYRRVLGLALLSAIAYGAGSAYLNSPNRHCRLALEDLQEELEAASPDEALQEYRALYGRCGSRPSVARVVPNEMAIIAASQVERPMTPDRVHQIQVVVSTVTSLTPAVHHTNRAVDTLATQLDQWADDLGTATPEAARAAQRLAELASTVPGLQNRFGTLHAEASLTLARELEADWPADALTAFLQVGTPEADAAGREVISRIMDSPALALERSADIDRALDADPTGYREQVATQLVAARAWADDPARAEAIGAGGAALEAHCADNPHDQEALVALANARLAAGDALGALALLETIGPPGLRIEAAQFLSAEILALVGENEEALFILSRYNARHIGPFLNAAADLEAGERALIDRLSRDAENGRLPEPLQTQLVQADEETAVALFYEHVRARMESDGQMRALTDAYLAHAGVVRGSMVEGTTALALANERTGDERDALLRQAESAFLAIRTEGAGLPEYHLGLAQVYYRLGRTEEAEEEARQGTASGSAESLVYAAQMYRDLGMLPRAREVAALAAEVSSDAELSGHIAVLRSLIAESDAEATELLEQAPQTEEVERSRRNADAYAAMRNGEYEAAAAMFAQIADEYAQYANSDIVSANNAAVALQARFSCLGDIADLQEAGRLLDIAVTGAETSIVVDNAQSLNWTLAAASALGARLPLDELNLSEGDLSSLRDALWSGTDGPAFREAILASPSYARALEQARLLMVLAPNQPSSYLPTLAHCDSVDDGACIERIRSAITSVDLDTTDIETTRARQLAGDFDEEIVAALTRQVERAQQRFDRVAEDDGVAHDAAAYLLANALVERSGFLLSLDDADACERALGAVDDDAFDTTMISIGLILARAYARVASQHPDLRATLYTNLLQFGGGPVGALYLLRNEPAAGSLVVAALAPDRDALVQHALAIDGPPTLSGHAIGLLLDDPDVRALHGGVVTDPSVRALSEIRLQADAGSTRTRFAMSLLDGT